MESRQKRKRVKTSNEYTKPSIKNKQNEQHMNNSDDSDSEYESVSSYSDEVLEDEGGQGDNSVDYEENKEDINESESHKQQTNKVNVMLWDEKGNSKLKPNEQLDFDNKAYEMLHRSKIEWPCLTIDFVIPENFPSTPIKTFYLKNDMRKLTNDAYPYSTYMLAGSQTNESQGYLYYMKWYNMYKTKYDDDPDKGLDSDEEEAQEPFMKFQKVKMKGNINRLKTMKNSYISAMWTDSPSIEIVNIKELIEDLETQNAISTENEEMQVNTKKKKVNPKNIVIKSFNKKTEGFGIDWNNITPGIFAIGGMDNKIEVYSSKDESCSDFILSTESSLFKGHNASIEDIQWSPNENTVFASCSVDKSIRFWDLRTNMQNTNNCICIPNAHESDVNVISWNHTVTSHLASGGDDNVFKVWDLRYINMGAISNVKWHRGPITSLMWDPYEEAQLAVCSEDNRLSIWDFAVETEGQQTFYDNYNNEIPQQIVFLHQGQEHLKDVKFHPYFKNMVCSTAENGINIFKPAFDEDSDEEDENDDDGYGMELD